MIENNDNKELIPYWIVQNLSKYGNCLVSRTRVKKCLDYGCIEKMIYDKYSIKCKLTIIMDKRYETNSKFPEHANYILEVTK